MKIKCPRCKSQLEVDAIGDFVACFHCSLEFTVDEPTIQEPTDDVSPVDEPPVDEPEKRKSIWFFLTNFRWSKINWIKLGVGGLSIFLGIIFVCAVTLAVVLNKSKNNIQLADLWASMIDGVGVVIVALIGLAFMCLLFVNIILWIFLPLMVYSIKKSLEEAVREIKNLKNL